MLETGRLWLKKRGSLFIGTTFDRFWSFGSWNITHHTSRAGWRCQPWHATSGSKEQAAPTTLLTMLHPIKMSSLIIILAIILRSCNLSTSFSINPLRSQKHFFPNSKQHKLPHLSTSLFSTAAAIHHLDDDNMRDLLFSTPSDAPSAVLVDAYTQW